MHLIWPALYILCSIFVTVLPCFADPVGTGLGNFTHYFGIKTVKSNVLSLIYSGALITATGVPVYFLFIGWKDKPAFIKNAIDSFTVTVQKLLLVVQADKTD